MELWLSAVRMASSSDKRRGWPWGACAGSAAAPTAEAVSIRTARVLRVFGKCMGGRIGGGDGVRGSGGVPATVLRWNRLHAHRAQEAPDIPARCFLHRFGE